MERILLLGEGNFSFTKSLYLALTGGGLPRYLITTSSYDTQEDISAKYPEAKSHLSFLSSKASGVTIRHGIDALERLSAQLDVSALQEYVIFNFPHIGKEDCHLHKSFLGHLLYRVKEMLAPAGLFYLTLAEGQAENWCLAEMVARQGFHLIKTFTFVPSDFPFYQMKRHQVGKSFKQRITSHHTFVLSIVPQDAESGAESSVSSAGGDLKQDIFELIINKNRDQVFSEIVNGAVSTSVVGDGLHEQKQPKPKKVKKRKMVELTAGMYEEVTRSASNAGTMDTTSDRSNSSGNSGSFFRCLSPPCAQKEFSSEQGVRTHVYVEHVLQKPAEGGRKYQLRALEAEAAVEVIPQTHAEAQQDPQYRCRLCGSDTDSDKVYTSIDALYQHVTAKHQSTPTPTPVATQFLPNENNSQPPLLASAPNQIIVSESHKQEARKAAAELTLCCEICGVLVTSLADHLASLKPPDIQSFQCTLCGKSGFQSERSIQQHRRFCVLACGEASGCGSQ